jgi:hypothetical protein
LRCRKETIREYQSYVWDAKAQFRGEDKPLKANDHCMDASRYLVNTLFARGPVLAAKALC